MEDVKWWDDTESPAFSSQVITIESRFTKAKKWLTKKMTAYLEKMDAVVPRRLHRKDGFHPSSMGSHFCPRMETFRRLLPRAYDGKKFAGSTQLRFELGKAGHSHWQDIIYGKMRLLKGTWACNRCIYMVDGTMPDIPCLACGWPVHKRFGTPAPASEQSVPCQETCHWPDGFDADGRDCAQCNRGGKWTFEETDIEIPKYEIVGHFDGIIDYDGEDRVLEFKTKYPEAFPLQEPDEDHVIQCNVYMWALDHPLGVIVYLNKSTGETTDFLLEQDPSVKKLVIQRIEFVRTHVAEGTFPNGVCGGPKAPDAKTCPFSDVCFWGYDDIETLKEQLAAREELLEQEEDDGR